MLRRLVMTVLLLSLLGIAVNDAIHIGTDIKHLRLVTYELTRWAAENAQTMTRDQAAAKILADAQTQGVTLYAYDQTDKAVRVFTSMGVTGTIIAGPVYNMIEGKPFEDAWKSPLIIRDHQDAGFAH